MDLRTGRRSTLVALGALASVSATGCVTGLNRLKPDGTFVHTEGVAYGPHQRHRLDVYQPTGSPPPGGWPVVVFFYGGSWHWGDRHEYSFAGEALASRGVLALITDYRLYPEARWPDFLHDSAQASAYALRESARWGGDPQRVHLMGHRAGAYNAAMLALDERWLTALGHHPRELAGWIGLAGPYEFLPVDNPQARLVFHHPDYPPGTQPIDYVRADSPRVFLGTAEYDHLVESSRNTVQMAARLKAAGVPMVVKHYKGLDHVTLVASMAWSLRWMSPVLNDVTAFVKAAPPRPTTPTTHR